MYLFDMKKDTLCNTPSSNCIENKLLINIKLNP